VRAPHLAQSDSGLGDSKRADCPVCRAASLGNLDKWPESYDAALKCLLLKPDWPKAYFRVAQALVRCLRSFEARSCCDAGLQVTAAPSPAFFCYKLYVDRLPCAQIDPDNKELKDLRARSQGLVESFIERVYFPRDAPAARTVSGAAKACGIGVCAL
jgi:hypothetical protein